MIDHKKLRKLAEETLKGDTCVLGKQLCRTVNGKCIPIATFDDDPDLEFAAVANPKTIITLLDEISYLQLYLGIINALINDNKTLLEHTRKLEQSMVLLTKKRQLEKERIELLINLVQKGIPKDEWMVYLTENNKSLDTVNKEIETIALEEIFKSET